jgi:hypothetical protein
MGLCMVSVAMLVLSLILESQLPDKDPREMPTRARGTPHGNLDPSLSSQPYLLFHQQFIKVFSS